MDARYVVCPRRTYPRRYARSVGRTLAARCSMPRERLGPRSGFAVDRGRPAAMLGR